MKVWYLYAIPVVWFISGLPYAMSLPKDGFVGAAAVSIVFLVGFALLIGIITYHITKKVIWSVLSVPVVFTLLILLVRVIDYLVFK